MAEKADPPTDAIEPARSPSTPSLKEEEKAAAEVKTRPEREPKPGDYFVRLFLPVLSYWRVC
jgi:hypothetical protein